MVTWIGKEWGMERKGEWGWREVGVGFLWVGDRNTCSSSYARCERGEAIDFQQIEYFCSSTMQVELLV